MANTLMLFIILSLSILLHVSTAAVVCPANACKNGGECVTPRLYTSIGVGEYMVYALSEKKVYSIGQMFSNVNGIGTNGMGPGNTYLVNITSAVDVVDIKAGLHHSIALDNETNVWTWGDSYYGTPNGLQGVGPNFHEPNTPTKILVDSTGKKFTNIIQIAPGDSFNMALTADGTVFVWGDVSNGFAGDLIPQTGSERIIDRPTAVKIDALKPGTKIVQVATGGSTVVLARGSDGTVYSWGGGGTSVWDLGLGEDVEDNPWEPAIVNLDTTDIIWVGVGGDSFQYALSSNGTVYGWGMRGYYLGLGDGESNWVPTPNPTDLTSALNFPYRVRSLYPSKSHTVAILIDGSLWSWGFNNYVQVGNGKMNETGYVHKPVNIMPNKDWLEVYASGNTAYYSYAQTTDGKLYSWGRSKFSMLGNGLEPTGVQALYNGDFNVPVPTRVDPLKVTNVFSQTAYTCLVDPDIHPACEDDVIPVDFCHPSHCSSGTTCQVLDGGYRFVCDCSTTSPLMAGITCNITDTPIPATTGFSCNCPPGWTGNFCEDAVPIDPSYVPPTSKPTTPAQPTTPGQPTTPTTNGSDDDVGSASVLKSAFGFVLTLVFLF